MGFQHVTIFIFLVRFQSETRDSTISLMTLSSTDTSASSVGGGGGGAMAAAAAANAERRDEVSSMSSSSSKLEHSLYEQIGGINIFCFSPGVFDTSLDRSDRKISAHATLETPVNKSSIGVKSGSRMSAAVAATSPVRQSQPPPRPQPPPSPRMQPPQPQNTSSPRPKSPMATLAVAGEANRKPEREKSDLDVRRRNKGKKMATVFVISAISFFHFTLRQSTSASERCQAFQSGGGQ